MEAGIGGEDPIAGWLGLDNKGWNVEAGIREEDLIAG
jgi:hypothetical protein